MPPRRASRNRGRSEPTRRSSRTSRPPARADAPVSYALPATEEDDSSSDCEIIGSTSPSGLPPLIEWRELSVELLDGPPSETVQWPQADLQEAENALLYETDLESDTGLEYPEPLSFGDRIAAQEFLARMDDSSLTYDERIETLIAQIHPVVATHIPSVGHRGPLKHHIPQPLNLKEGDGYDGGDEQEEEDDVSEPELGDPKPRPKPKLRTGPKEGSKKKRAKKVIVEVATEEGESATDLEEGAGVESGGGGQSDSSGSGSTPEPEASNDNNTDLRTKDTDPGEDTNPSCKASFPLQGLQGLWETKFERKYSQNHAETPFFSLFRPGFINTFINTLFTNLKLKTVYNAPQNYKQSPRHQPRSCTPEQYNIQQGGSGKRAERFTSDSRDNETVGGAVSGGRAQSKKRKEISETEEPQLGKRVRKARVGNTEAVPTPNIWNSESYKNAAAGVTLPHTSELRRSTRTNHAFRPNKWQSVSLQDSDIEGDMIPSRHVAAPLIKCLLQDASLVVIEALNLHAIKRNLHDVETAWEAASQAVATTLDLQELDIAYSALLQHPDASSTTTYFPSIWRGLNRMNGLHAMTSLRTRLDRECIMLTTFFAWRWLDVFCPQKIQEAVEARRQSILPTMWIGKLACDVAAVLERRADHHTFIASKYGLALASAEFNFSNKRREILVDNKALLEATTTHTAQIIASWLEFPVGGVSRYQAWFVEAITQTIGLRALLLDEVWRAYVQIRKYVLGDSIARPHCLRQFQTLLLQLRAHPLAQASSSEADVLSRLAQVMELVRAPAAAPLSLMDVDEIPDSDSHPQLPDNSTAQALTASALTLPHPAIALYSLSKTPSAPAQQKLAVFMQFLDKALAATRQGHGLTEWQSFMLSNMDRLCPFRELAPSRQRAAGPLGPYTSDFAATQSGFLSALIFRAITFNTDFLATARMRYTDHEDFASVMKDSAARFTAEHGRNPTPAFFCNSSAYGPHNAGRTVNLAAIYGPLVATENIAAQLASTDAASISFTAFWDWLRGSVNGRVRFYQLGSLGSYLLAADYTYTNPRLVQPPTIEELGAIICRLNKGAVRGLELLNLIPERQKGGKKPKSSTPDACIEGLRIVYNTIYEHWPPEVRQEVQFDLVMIEHSLCKLARALGKNKFSF
ncbi:hypothetical protein B0H12DRAFT_1073359 [Mycena haematopus]|nr:hypothetical protein B0H12DRAFT_1073359 [Mycena haematopus]